MVDFSKFVLGWPVDAGTMITQGFGENPENYAIFGLPGHNGVDFGCVLGTPIRAAANGTVTSAKWDTSSAKGGYGMYVVIDHGGFTTLYAHLSQFVVGAGTKVFKGNTIGLSGNTGNSTGPHLHFTLKIPGKGAPGYSDAVDPMAFFEAISSQQSAVSDQPSSPGTLTNDVRDASHLLATLGKGSKVRLKAGNDYVNIRNGPGLGYVAVGKLLPEDTEKTVVEVDGEWACLLKWAECALWCHTGYLEVVDNGE